MQKNRRTLILALYAVVALYILPMYPHGGSANELTRWATAASLIERRSFDITWTEGLIGPNVDTAKVGGATYSNKPPGVALLTTPVYAIARIFVGPPDASNIRVSWFLMKLAVSTLPLLLLSMWLYRRGVNEYGLAALLFATPLFGYSLLLFSHVPVAVLLYAAYRLLFDSEVVSTRRDIIAGALCGLAVVSEFPAVFVVAVLGIGLLFTATPARRAGYFVLGGSPFLVLLLAYNSLLFGSPLSFSYAHESFPEWAAVASRGILGISFPTLENAYLLLFSPARGLFFNSPILALGVLTFFIGRDRSSLGSRVKIAVVLVTIILLCGHGAAHGGWGFGARYLVLIVPFLLDGIWRDDTSLERVPSVVKGALLSISIAFAVLPVLTFPFAPPEFQLPQNDFWIRLILDEGWVVPNIANVIGLTNPLWTVIPILTVVAIAMIMVAISDRSRTYFSSGVVLGVLISIGIMVLPGQDSAEDQFRRVTISERFFRPADRLAAFRRGAEMRNDWVLLRRINEAEWNIADTRAYAPNDFPYLHPQSLGGSPSATMRSAIDAQKRGDIGRAESLITEGKNDFAFARCEFAGNRAVLYYITGKKLEALAELEAVQSMVNPASRPDCIRTQYLLGTLYRESSRDAEADATFRLFLQNSAGTSDPELLSFRQQLSRTSPPR